VSPLLACIVGDCPATRQRHRARQATCHAQPVYALRGETIPGAAFALDCNVPIAWL